MTDNKSNMELPKIRRCEYRGCTKIVEGRKNKKFCSENHRKMEFICESRDKSKIKTEKNHLFKMISDYQNNPEISNDLMDLYKKIYGNESK